MITNPVALLFILATLVIIAIFLEQYPTFKKLGAAALVILFGLILSNLGLIPGDSIVYDYLMDAGVNAAIVLILLSVDIGSVRKAGPQMLKAFGVGAIGSAVGSFSMALILAKSLGPETWKLAGQFTGTYIGGGVNFSGLAREFETDSDLFSAGIAADVIVTSFWLIACLTVPVILGNDKEKEENQSAEKEDALNTLEQFLYSSKDPIHILHLAILVSITFGSIWLSGLIGSLFPVIPNILWLTTIVILTAQIPMVKKLSGGAMIGNYLLLLFLACNGAKSVIANIVAVGPEIFYYALGTVMIHGIIIFGIGSLFGINAGTLAVASQANIGGSSSAMALASARGYTDKILPGIAVGLLGYAVGNYFGIAVAHMANLVL